MAITTPRPLTDHELATAAGRLEHATAAEVVRWAHQRFGDGLCLLASFADTVLVDVAVSEIPDLPVVTLDTGFGFAETIETTRRAQRRYSLDLTVVRADPDAPDLWQAGTEACCAARKVASLERALTGRTAWISGLRRSDSTGRRTTPVVERDSRGLVKVNPLARWTDDDVARHTEERGLIINPLAVQGYGSIGCWPCTEPGVGREGRWAGSDRSECGIHA